MRPTKAIKKMRDQATQELRYQEGKSVCLHRLSTWQTKMAMVYEVTFSAVHKTIFPVVRIELTKAVISLQVKIKPTKPITSTFKVQQEVYRVPQDHQKAAAHLSAW